eukprot:2990905-Pyramimonas_sp.AAC.1
MRKNIREGAWQGTTNNWCAPSHPCRNAMQSARQGIHTPAVPVVGSSVIGKLRGCASRAARRGAHGR